MEVMLTVLVSYPGLFAGRCYLSCDVQCGQRVALSGMSDRQYSHNLVDGAGVGSAASLRCSVFMALTAMKMQNATMRKSITVLINEPYAMTAAPAALASASDLNGPLLLSRLMNKSVKLTLPMTLPIGGMMMSLTTEVTILPKAPPMITPTARSTTLPRIANSLNSLIIPMTVSPFPLMLAFMLVLFGAVRSSLT